MNNDALFLNYFQLIYSDSFSDTTEWNTILANKRLLLVTWFTGKYLL